VRVMQQLWGSCEGDAAIVRVGNCEGDAATVRVGNCEGDAATVGQL